jgi:hypothetical protein
MTNLGRDNASVRTRPCGADIRRGRLRKAEQFADAANLIHEYVDTDDDDADAYVTLCVHAGIAASDVICCAVSASMRRGESQRGNRAPERVETDAAKHLSVLLGLKTKSGYSHMPATRDEVKRAGRAAEALIETGRRRNAAVGG